MRSDGRVTVQELIDRLMKIEDKSIPVHVACEGESISWAMNNIDSMIFVSDETNYDVGKTHPHHTGSNDHTDKTGHKILVIC